MMTVVLPSTFLFVLGLCHTSTDADDFGLVNSSTDQLLGVHVWLSPCLFDKDAKTYIPSGVVLSIPLLFALLRALSKLLLYLAFLFNSLIIKYNIPRDLRPRLPPPDIVMSELSNDAIGFTSPDEVLLGSISCSSEEKVVGGIRSDYHKVQCFRPRVRTFPYRLSTDFLFEARLSLFTMRIGASAGMMSLSPFFY
ncbi:hypothetical protein Tco_0487273 [Tanacetum coccineum]